MSHRHRLTAYPVDWDLTAFMCNKKGCLAQLLCPHCGATMFELGYDEAAEDHVWTCWRGGCGRDVTAYIQEQVEEKKE